MASLRPSGQVQTSQEIRDGRHRKGLCETCSLDPVQCYEIKRRMGGLIHDRVPLTEDGKVFNGVCLRCHPDKDPRMMIRRARTDEGRTRHQHQHREHRHRRHPQEAQDQEASFRHNPNRRRSGEQLPYNMNRDRDDRLERAPSYPQMSRERRPIRQKGSINLSASMREEDDRISQSLPANFYHENSAARIDNFGDEFEQDQNEDPGYVEEITYNIFNEPVIVRKPKHRKSKRLSRHDATPSSPSHSDRRRQSQSHGHVTPPPPYEEKVEEDAPENFDYYSKPKPPLESMGRDGYDNKGNIFHRQDSIGRDEYGNNNGKKGSFRRQDSGPRHSPPRQHSSRRGLLEEAKIPSIPELAPASDADAQSVDNESLDELQKLIAQHVAKNPEVSRKFVPGSHTVIPGGAELELDGMDDNMSVLTRETCWRGRETVSTLATRQKSHMTGLSAITETPSTASSDKSDKQPSMASHRIVEPAATQDMESYLESSVPQLASLREIVGQCTQIGADETAIEVVTQALVHDNATSMSQDLAMFCLTTLWILARKNDENKRKIIFEDVSFEVIIEAMRIYCDSSAVIQTRACGVLWSLAMASNDRKHIAQGGGCESILNAMLAHTEDDALQVMALGALKVLSFDNIGKSKLRAFGAMQIVCQIMQKHMNNPSIQSEGCVILGNLAVDEANQNVMPVTEKEIEAVIMGMLAHPDSLDVQEAACFTLMSLASLSANVELIQSNVMSKEALELAFQKHPDDVGKNILTLLRRLKFDAPEIAEESKPPNGS